MRLIDADKLRERLNPDDWGTPDERWRPEREFGGFIDAAPTVNLWHYPSKGDYPTDDRRVLCKLRGADNWYECGGYDKDDDTWGFEGFIACGSEVVAWQYIVPPKENE